MAKTKLRPSQEQAALLLSAGWKQAAVARKMGIAPQTVTRWMKNSDFVARISELSQDLTAQSLDLLREEILKNTEIVLRIAKVGGEPGVVSSQLKAALWCVEKVMGAPEKLAAKANKAAVSAQADLLRLPESELEELENRGLG